MEPQGDVTRLLADLCAGKAEAEEDLLPIWVGTEANISFFGGTPRTGVEAETAAAAIPLPKMDPSAAPVVPKRKRKKKKGC